MPRKSLASTAAEVNAAYDKLSPDHKRHIELGWKIIEWKVAYYKPEAVHKTRQADCELHDDLYDQYEQEYLRLCLKLGRDNTVVHKSYESIGEVPGDGMFEIEEARPSVKLVLAKLGSPKQ